MSGNKNSGNRAGRTLSARQKTVAPRSPAAQKAKVAMPMAKIKKCPAPPTNPVFDKRAKVIWRRYCNRLIKADMLTELDLDALEWAVVAARSAELAAEGPAGAARATSNAVKVITALKSIGLTRDGRVAATPAEVNKSAAEQVAPLNNLLKFKPRDSRKQA